MSVRREPVPAAYRVFFRQIGLDPDVARTPIEAAVLERMLHGGFLSGGLLADVLLIALVDTGVPVWALDAEAVDGPLGIRASREGERLGPGPTRRRCRPAGWWSPTPRRRWRMLFGEPRRRHGRERARASWRCSRCRSPACRRCTSKRRCGRAARLWSSHARSEHAMRKAAGDVGDGYRQ